MTTRREGPMRKSPLSHLDEHGRASMVDVSDKEQTLRIARAGGNIQMNPATLALIASGSTPKGDVLATARIAGIMAAKRTYELIPLCHPLALSKISVSFIENIESSSIEVETMVKLKGRTGVEMEALTAVAVACLTIYDMLKAVDKSMTITGIKLLEKTGGRSGTYTVAPQG